MTAASNREKINLYGEVYLLPTVKELETLVSKGYDNVSAILDLWYPGVSRIKRERLSVRIRKMLDKCPTVERYGYTFAPKKNTAVVRYRLKEAEE